MQRLPCLDIKLKRVVFHEAFYKFVYLLGHFGQIWQRKSKVKIWKTSEGGRKKRNLIIIEREHKACSNLGIHLVHP